MHLGQHTTFPRPRHILLGKLALVGLILGVVSFIRKRQVEEPTGTALAGIILNAIPLLVMTALAVFVGIGADASTINDMTIK